jgi:hypothetical protein
MASAVALCCGLGHKAAPEGPLGAATFRCWHLSNNLFAELGKPDARTWGRGRARGLWSSSSFFATASPTAIPLAPARWISARRREMSADTGRAGRGG